MSLPDPPITVSPEAVPLKVSSPAPPSRKLEPEAAALENVVAVAAFQAVGAGAFVQDLLSVRP